MSIDRGSWQGFWERAGKGSKRENGVSRQERKERQRGGTNRIFQIKKPLRWKVRKGLVASNQIISAFGNSLADSLIRAELWRKQYCDQAITSKLLILTVSNQSKIGKSMEQSTNERLTNTLMFCKCKEKQNGTNDFEIIYTRNLSN